ncbi:3',5'-cyclic-nucleotide phosphodiesterase PDE2 Ecym_5025 [Eremothecium cymbalariae DBVPG|uniref:Phosphodiesterase n=1 Tax=Eremothecium cymbalariae (strain CBS 270.75 / DBVPG 7215 / KCTC 17166 / NRRL Y-17582) TaxID=931890 RepID=I6NCN3_ERECY|nr:hypothetical protein Ecym_5025 [Eremothecium cymbalariae DBVPG\
MVQVFFVNCPVAKAAIGPEATVCSFSSAPDLLNDLFVKRLSNKDDYENTISIVVYDDAGQELTIEQLRELFSNFMLCLNIAVADSKNWTSTLKEALIQESKYIPDKLTSTCHWMYAEQGSHGPGLTPCSLNVYSMVEQLSRLPKDENKADTWYLDYLLKKITISELISLDNEDSHYWSLLDTWSFSAHTLCTLELIQCAKLILSRMCAAAAIPCLREDEFYLFLIHLEFSYHQGNKFHNFRHAVDVMQATYKLCEMLELDSNIALAICISAIGHDVGHPGTNNGLLCNFKSPIAKRYNMVSVLENFHTDLFMGILKQHWPSFITAETLKSIREAIISTDMALHDRYLEDLRLSGTQNLEDNMPLMISLIIKAADISNVSRPLLISAQWAVLIAYELNECMLLEKKLKSLPIDTEKDIMLPLSSMPDSVEAILAKFPSIPKGQLYFINAFVEKLFTGLANKFDKLKFLADNVQSNKNFWLKQLGDD